MDMGRKRYRFDFAVRDPYAMDFSALGYDNRLSVARPGIARKNSPHAVWLIHFHLNRIHQHALRAGLQIAKPKCGARAVFVSFIGNGAVENAARESEPSAIGRNFRSIGSAVGQTVLLFAGSRSDLFFIASAKFDALDLYETLRGVIVPSIG